MKELAAAAEKERKAQEKAARQREKLRRREEAKKSEGDGRAGAGTRLGKLLGSAGTGRLRRRGLGTRLGLAWLHALRRTALSPCHLSGPRSLRERPRGEDPVINPLARTF